MATDKEEIEQFWKDKEQELGEDILKRGLVHVINGGETDFTKDTWCLGILTKSRLILEEGENQNWLATMMKKKQKLGSSLVIPLDQMVPPEKIIPKGFLNRLLQSGNLYSIKWNEAEKLQEIVIELDKMGQDLISSLL